MGEYFLWVNVDRREVIDPYDFGYGSKRYESIYRDCTMLAALRELLSEQWSGCQIAWLGDETIAPPEDRSGLFEKLEAQGKALPYRPGSVMDVIWDRYVNISGLFQAAEEAVREEIGHYLLAREAGDRAVRNEYGIDATAPYRGLFSRTGKNFRYVLNRTKGLCYSPAETEICFPDGSRCDFADPFPTLMQYGRTAPAGAWFGDLIGVADAIPDGFRLLDKIVLH